MKASILPAEDTSTPSRIMRGGVEASPESVARFGIGVLALLAVALVYVAHASIPETALRLPFESRAVTRQLVPEGWAFFTRDPREPDIRAYALEDASWTQIDQSYHGGALGFDRSSRHQSREVGYLLQGLPPADDWPQCTEALAGCLERHSNRERRIISNEFPGTRRLCGTVAIVLADPPPWAWAGLEVSSSSSVQLLEVEC